MTLGIPENNVTLSLNDTRYDDTRYDDTQYDDTQYDDTQYDDTQYRSMILIIQKCRFAKFPMLNVACSYCYAECRHAERRFTECRGVYKWPYLFHLSCRKTTLKRRQFRRKTLGLTMYYIKDLKYKTFTVLNY